MSRAALVQIPPSQTVLSWVAAARHVELPAAELAPKVVVVTNSFPITPLNVNASP
jgi:hypothetical protein